MHTIRTAALTLALSAAGVVLTGPVAMAVSGRITEPPSAAQSNLDAHVSAGGNGLQGQFVIDVGNDVQSTATWSDSGLAANGRVQLGPATITFNRSPGQPLHIGFSGLGIAPSQAPPFADRPDRLLAAAGPLAAPIAAATFDPGAFAATVGDLAASWVRTIVPFLILGLLLMLVVPGLSGVVRATSLTSPWTRFGIGLVVLITMPTAAIILLIAGIFIGVWWLGLMLLGLYGVTLAAGYAFAGMVIGRAVVDRLGWPRAHQFWALLAGLALLSLLTLVPYVGPLVDILAITYGMGALVLAPRTASVADAPPSLLRRPAVGRLPRPKPAVLAAPPVTNVATAPLTDVQALARDAYVYGYPLVKHIDRVMRTSRTADNPAAVPLNAFRHAASVASPAASLWRSVDTLDSLAHCDLALEPLVLHVPDMSDRYYVLQFVDAWMNNFAYIGRRATGTAERRFVIVPPGWQVDLGPDVPAIHAPTRIVSIVGRTAVDGPAEAGQVSALHEGFTLSPLSAGGDTTSMSALRSADDLRPNPAVPKDLQYWERLRVFLQACPPPERERTSIRKFEPLGLLANASPYVKTSRALHDTLVTGARAGDEFIEQSRSAVIPTVNGWLDTAHLFDYNRDFLEIGTVDDPAWKCSDPSQANVRRAVAARAAPWGSHGYELARSATSHDAAGVQLTGTHRYEWRLNPPPPVDAFWSVSVYDAPGFFSENPINRHAIADRSPGIRSNENGSLIIRIQREAPGAKHLANWLPSPPGDFHLIARLYQPQTQALDGESPLPPITRVS